MAENDNASSGVPPSGGNLSSRGKGFGLAVSMPRGLAVLSFIVACGFVIFFPAVLFWTARSIFQGDRSLLRIAYSIGIYGWYWLAVNEAVDGFADKIWRRSSVPHLISLARTRKARLTIFGVVATAAIVAAAIAS